MTKLMHKKQTLFWCLGKITPLTPELMRDAKKYVFYLYVFCVLVLMSSCVLAMALCYLMPVAFNN